MRGSIAAIRIGEIHQEDLVARYTAPYRMVICAAPAYLARYGTPAGRKIADHLCLSHTVWTARNEWRLPGVEGEVRWKRDAVLRCNDGYALRGRRSPGPRLLMQPEVLLADALASGGTCACWRRGPHSETRASALARIVGPCRS